MTPAGRLPSLRSEIMLKQIRSQRYGYQFLKGNSKPNFEIVDNKIPQLKIQI
jgi:hypothetical protein